jgi:hypothetical protein
MSWYNPLQNTIYCGKLKITTYYVYQGESDAAYYHWREETWCG